MTLAHPREYCVELTVTAYIEARDTEEARDLAEQLSENIVLTDRVMHLGHHTLDDAAVRDVTEIVPDLDEDYHRGGDR